MLACWICGAVLMGGAATGQQPVAVRQPEPYRSIDTEAAQPASLDGAPSSDESLDFGPGATCGPQAECPDLGAFGPCPSPPQCCEICGGGNCCPHRFYVNQGIRVLNRSRPREQHLTEDVFAISFGQAVPVISPGTVSQVFAGSMSTNAALFSLSSGYALTIGDYLGRDSSNRDDYFEFSYWGLNRFSQSAQYNGRNLPDLLAPTITWGSLHSPFPITVGGFNRVQIHTQEYTSENHSFEWDLRLTPRGRPDRLVLQPNGKWRRECQPGRFISYIFGLRYMIINESFAFRGRGTIDRAGTLENVSGDYLVFSHNNLVGLQIGADLFWRRCRWEVGIRSKVGPYVNYADQSSEIATSAFGKDPIAGPDLAIHRHAAKDEAALIGEVGFVGSYRVRPNLTLHAAWDFMWITGLALAPEQLDFRIAPLERVDTQGSTFIQGLTLQAELAW